MSETAISSTTTSEKGISAIDTARRVTVFPFLNPSSRNPERIANNVCPASILLNNRIPKLSARALKDTNSIGANTGLRTPGVPCGMNWHKNKERYNVTLRITSQTHNVTDPAKEKISDVATVYPKGELPNKLVTPIKRQVARIKQ
jgi:hypothetical protein